MAAAPAQPAQPARPERPLPAWFAKAGLGIIIHWGPYAIPGFNPPRPQAPFPPRPGSETPLGNGSEWYYCRLANPGRYGPETRDFHADEYKDTEYTQFGPAFEFTLELGWDADTWAYQFASAGARYVVLTARHHDGYLLCPPETPAELHPDNSADSTPKSDKSPTNPALGRANRWYARRDIIGELAAAVRARGMRFGIYFSIMNWLSPNYRSAAAVARSRNSAGRSAYTSHVLEPLLRALVTRYEPSVLWLDGGWAATAEHWGLDGFYRWLYEESPVRDEIVVNDRGGKGCVDAAGRPLGDFTSSPDRLWPAADVPPSRMWESCLTIAESWGYSYTEMPGDLNKSVVELYAWIARTMALGGNALLNVGPTACGIIPYRHAQILEVIGTMLRGEFPGCPGLPGWAPPAPGCAISLAVPPPATAEQKSAAVEETVTLIRNVYAEWKVIIGRRLEYIAARREAAREAAREATQAALYEAIRLAEQRIAAAEARAEASGSQPRTASDNAGGSDPREDLAEHPASVGRGPRDNLG